MIYVNALPGVLAGARRAALRGSYLATTADRSDASGRGDATAGGSVERRRRHRDRSIAADDGAHKLRALSRSKGVTDE